MSPAEKTLPTVKPVSQKRAGGKDGKKSQDGAQTFRDLHGAMCRLTAIHSVASADTDLVKKELALLEQEPFDEAEDSNS